MYALFLLNILFTMMQTSGPNTVHIKVVHPILLELERAIALEPRKVP